MSYTQKCTYMPLNGTQGMSIKSDGIPGIFPKGVDTERIYSGSIPFVVNSISLSI
jgi:hypothetical protein